MNNHNTSQESSFHRSLFLIEGSIAKHIDVLKDRPPNSAVDRISAIVDALKNIKNTIISLSVRKQSNNES
jgi:hypothetical protein